MEDKTGTESYSYWILNDLLKLPEVKEHKFILFVRSGAIGWKKMARKRNVEVVEVKWKYLWTQIGLAGETWRRSLDVLWVPAHTLPIFRKPGLKTVVTIHGLEYEWLPEYKNWLQRWYLPLSTRYAVKSASKLIAVSEFTKSQLVDRLRANPAKIEVVYEGAKLSVLEEKFTKAQQRRVISGYGITGEYLLFVGTLQPRKNLEFLIEVYGGMVKKGFGGQLAIVGSEGWMYESIYSAVEELQLEGKVIFAGRVSERELAILYKGARLYVQPSLTEGFGLPVLEAMSVGVPVVSSAGGALPEVVGEAGVIVEGFNAAEWERKIRLVWRKESYRQKLIKAGKKHASKWTWKRTAEKTMNVLVNI